MSVVFNGSNSSLIHTTADVLASEKKLTLCFWSYAAGLGEGNIGYVLVLPENPAGGNAYFLLAHFTSANLLAITKDAGGAGTAGGWTFPANDNQWNAISISLDFSGDNAPLVRVNFANVIATQTSAPSGINDQPPTGFGIGNRAADDRTWNGRLFGVQLWNRILTNTEKDAALRSPGTISTGLRLYVPMTTASNVADASGNGFNATAANLATGADPPDFVPSLGGQLGISIGIGF